MLTTLVLSAALLVPAAVPQPSDSLRALFDGGRPFPAFLEAAKARKDQWHDHYDAAQVPDATLQRARKIDGTWHLLVVAEDWCGDSANTIPYLARLVEQVDNLDMRVINSKVGRGVMEAHRTPDGRPSTPTVLLLNADWKVSGCFVERPAPLMDWFQANREDQNSDDLHAYIYDWYGKDAGATTVSEIVDLMQAAASGSPRCTEDTP